VAEPARPHREDTILLYYNKSVGIEFTDSAGKHGFSREDALWAIERA